MPHRNFATRTAHLALLGFFAYGSRRAVRYRCEPSGSHRADSDDRFGSCAHDRARLEHFDLAPRQSRRMSRVLGRRPRGARVAPSCRSRCRTQSAAGTAPSTRRRAARGVLVGTAALLPFTQSTSTGTATDEFVYAGISTIQEARRPLDGSCERLDARAKKVIAKREWDHGVVCNEMKHRPHSS
jgi:hypothetical protein